MFLYRGGDHLAINRIEFLGFKSVFLDGLASLRAKLGNPDHINLDLIILWMLSSAKNASLTSLAFRFG
jgi:hypothetical protein